MNEFDGKPPAGWLNQLHEAGHWDRLIEMATRSLAVEPNEAEPHRHLAWAYAKTGRFPEMWRHVEFLLHAEPEEPRNHHLAAVYYLETNRHKKAQPHIDTLLRTDPNSATYHYLACIQCLRRDYVRSARIHIERARALAPNWAAAAHLQINIDSIGKKAAREEWARVRQLKETLALDPRNANVMEAIGDTLLNKLDQPRDAEGFYREALIINPTNKACQGKLLDAIRARSIFYRTLSLPLALVRRIGRAFRKGRSHWTNVVRVIVLGMLAMKVLLLVVVWVVVLGAFFAPAAKLYEWFVMADIPQTKALPRFFAPLRKVQSWPLWVRMSAALGAIGGAWLLVLCLLLRVQLSLALTLMVGIFGAHYAAVAMLVGWRKLRARIGRRQDAKCDQSERGAVQSTM